MLTDIFSKRYRETSLFEDFTQEEVRLLTQSFRILSDQLIPYYDSSGKEDPSTVKVWREVHDNLSMELGLEELSPRYFMYPANPAPGGVSQAIEHTILSVCKSFFKAEPSNTTADEYLKDRISFIELAFRFKEEELKAIPKELPKQRPKSSTGRGFPIRLPTLEEREVTYKKFRETKFADFRTNVDELNTRFRQAKANLNYHNGFIQISADKMTETEIESPFWAIVSDSKWKNVDTDIKEAIDLRDNGGRDPAWYAVKALESTIKIISDEKGWSTGNEKGAHNFIDNLASKKNGNFIAKWEMEALKDLFTKVRNPFGHGAGSTEMPSLSDQQTQWAIETSMSWIKSLIKRA